jgi:hypothetical protein
MDETGFQSAIRLEEGRRTLLEEESLFVGEQTAPLDYQERL